MDYIYAEAKLGLLLRNGIPYEHYKELPTPGEEYLYHAQVIDFKGSEMVYICHRTNTGYTWKQLYSPGEVFYQALPHIPTGITPEFNEADINDLGNIVFVSDQVCYECVAYPQGKPDLAQIYENGSTFNLIDEFVKIEVDYGGKPFKLYYGREPVKFTGEDKYQFILK